MKNHTHAYTHRAKIYAPLFNNSIGGTNTLEMIISSVKLEDKGSMSHYKSCLCERPFYDNTRACVIAGASSVTVYSKWQSLTRPFSPTCCCTFKRQHINIGRQTEREIRGVGMIVIQPCYQLVRDQLRQYPK